MPSAFRQTEGEAGVAPRPFTRDIEKDASTYGRFLRLFGGIWAVVGTLLVALFLMFARGGLTPFLVGSALGGLFSFAGSLLWAIGWAQRRAALEVYRNGVEVQGTVVDVSLNTRVRMNRQNPWEVVYEYPGPHGEPKRGTAVFWTVDRPVAEAGQRVVVLHHPRFSSRSVLWTRLEPSRTEALRIATQTARIEAPAEEKQEPDAEEGREDAAAVEEAKVARARGPDS